MPRPSESGVWADAVEPGANPDNWSAAAVTNRSQTDSRTMGGRGDPSFRGLALLQQQDNDLMKSKPQHKSISQHIETIDIANLIPYARNARTHSDSQIAQIAASIREFGFTNPVLIDDKNTIVAGHARIEAARKLQIIDIPCIRLSHLTSTQLKAYIIADNKLALNAGWDLDALKVEFDELKLEDFDLELTGFKDLELDIMINKELKKIHNNTLINEFLYPPFSVFNARTWQERKDMWIALGIDSGKGREAALFKKASQIALNSINGASNNTSSIFDPVLTELMYRWFCPKGGLVLDPFAGGSVRGIVAAKLGYKYVGVDISEKQLVANREQWESIDRRKLDIDLIELTPADAYDPVWELGDSQSIDSICEGIEADFIFSCPPYYDLEQYTDDPNDLSNMTYDAFLKAYRSIINKSCALLKENRFACFVVGEIRDGKGIYRNYVLETIKAFIDAGLNYYNEAVLITQVGSLPIRTRKQFMAARKLGKTHQNVLIFIKGNPAIAAQDIGEIRILEMEDDASNS